MIGKPRADAFMIVESDMSLLDRMVCEKFAAPTEQVELSVVAALRAAALLVLLVLLVLLLVLTVLDVELVAFSHEFIDDCFEDEACG